jgi:hypothetical protein
MCLDRKKILCVWIVFFVVDIFFSIEKISPMLLIFFRWNKCVAHDLRRLYILFLAFFELIIFLFLFLLIKHMAKIMGGPD